jgi:hypothetical protein
MPNRVVGGDAISRSDKLLKIEPVAFRAEYSYLLTLALANGSFECEPRKIWTNLYAYNRPDFSPERVAEMLDVYERAKMLYRWSDAEGKIWGHWVGQLKAGRLPGAGRIKQGEKVGAPIPVQEMEAWLAVKQPVQSALGNRIQPVYEPYTDCIYGNGNGKGKGEGRGGAHAPAGIEQVRQETVPVQETSAAPFSFFTKNKTEEPTPATQEIIPAEPTVRPGPLPVPTRTKAPAPPAGYTPAYRTVQPPPNQRAPAAVASAPKPEPWDALDFAMELFLNGKEEFEGVDPKVAGRCVFHHFKVDKKKWWTSRIHTLEELKRHLPSMLEQMPPGATVPGGATMSVPVPDPDCQLCGGQGRTFGPHPGYDGIAYQAAFECSCVKEDLKPWRKWKPTRDEF